MAVRKGRKTKFKFIWTKELGFLIGGFLVLIGIVVALTIPTNSEQIYNDYKTAAEANTTDTATVTALAKEHVFYSVSLNNLASKISNASDTDEYIYVFYGTDKDSVSVSNINAFNSSIIQYNDAIELSSSTTSKKIERVYYLNADFVYDEEDKEDNEFEAKIAEKESKLPRSTIGVKEVDFFNYPSLWVFHKGSLVFNSDDYLNDSDALVTSWSFVCNKWIFTGYSQ